MPPKTPYTPFATRLSGSAKETQLRICSIFQWRKLRPPIWLFTLIAVGVLGCFSLVACRERAWLPGDENKTGADQFIVLNMLGEHEVWLGRSSMILRGIAKVSGELYMDEHFPEMKLHCVGVDWAGADGNFRIVFRDPSDSTYYSCSIGPIYFPVSINNGLAVIEQDYAKKYK